MVCPGGLDLLTAQRDISGDWIAAYKKYLHTGKPLSECSHVDAFMDKSYGMLDRSADHLIIANHVARPNAAPILQF